MRWSSERNNKGNSRGRIRNKAGCRSKQFELFVVRHSAFPRYYAPCLKDYAMQAEDPLPTRRSLVARLKRWDDRESWQEFFERYWKLIYGVAIRSGLNDSEAQDVV